MTSVAVLEFAGAGDVVTCGDVATGGLSALTVEGWFRVLDASGGNRPLLQKYGPGGREWALYVTLDARAYFVVYHAVTGSVSAAYSAAGGVPLGPWVHLAGCYNQTLSHVKVWINGVDRSSSLRPAGGGPLADTAQEMQLGGVLGDAEWPFIGRAGWQRISNVCRYPGILRMPDAYPVVDANTLGQWNLDEGAGGTTDNAEGTALYDGLISGCAWRSSVVDDKRRALPAVVRAYAAGWSQGVRV